MGKRREAAGVFEHAVEWRDGDGDRWMIDLTWAIVDDRAECVGLGLRSYVLDDDGEPRPVRSRDRLRPVRVDVWRAVPMSLIEKSRNGAINDFEKRGLWSSTDRAAESLRERWHAAFTSGGHHRKLVSADGLAMPADDALREVARVYRDAWRRGEPPTLAVAESLNLSRSAAAKRVSRARAAGMLPPTAKGRARGGIVLSE